LLLLRLPRRLLSAAVKFDICAAFFYNPVVIVVVVERRVFHNHNGEFFAFFAPV
jgi:hypothetical protein